MAWTKYKCIILYILLFNFNYFSFLPIKQLSSLEITGTIYTNYLDINSKSEEFINSNISSQANNIFFNNFTSTSSELLLSQNLRPGQSVEDYAVTITREGDHFVGRVVIAVRLTEATMEESISFNVEDLTIQSVLVGVLTSSNAVPAVFEIDRDNGILRITPDQPATSYSVIIEYTAPLRNDGTGLHLGRFGNSEYISMNLYPTHARRVFPCMDEPSLTSDTIFTFNNMGYNNIFANTLLAVNSENTFRPLSGPNHLWGMMAHNFNNTINIPLQNVHLYIRPSVASDQESHAVVAISNYYTGLNEWTGKPYLNIIQNQDEKLRIVAIPDISRDWYALSTVCIWEPYILIDINHSVKQRKIAFVHIAEAMARQWFGYVRYPANWRHQWVLSGLASYAAYEVATQFQTNPEDNSMIDMITIFTSEVIQESLFNDAYTGSLPLDPGENIFNERDIRTNINGLLRVKAPAILRMLRLIIDDEKKDIVKLAAQALMSSRSLQPVSTQIFYDALKSDFDGNGLVSRVDEFLQSWVTNNGYPVVNVLSRQNRIILTQERFGFNSRPNTKFIIPISFTTSLNPRFNNIYPTRILEEGDTINISLEKDDWIVLNIQGQGYYRVHYEDVLWQSLTNALRDSKERKIIHPLNRAALIDDSLNLARAGILDYDIALNLLLTMELETEYAVWKAFVRNMDFLRKRLMGYVKDESDERDKNIYLRMIQRTIGAVEENISFAPNSSEAESAMISLTRGLMMDHACRAGYGPCIAAAMRWFYDPNFEDVVNPGIPPEIRPAVYCTMMREGSEDDRTALLNRFDIEQSSYERLVILESLACSEDSSYIEELLSNTINPNGPYLTEERAKIFVAIASSCYKNAVLAVIFIRRNTNAVRNLYGGPEKLEEVIYALTDNLVDLSIVNHFDNWVSSLDSISNLQDSVEVARIVRDRARENLIWNNQYLEEVYTWIDKNDASTLLGIVSFTRITLNVLKTGIIPVWMSTSLGILHYFLSSIIKVDSMTLILFKYLYSVL